MNNTIREIAEKIAGCESILLFPHVNMDGDAIGSGAALCGALRKMGKRSYIPIEDEIAENLRFLNKGFCVPVSGGEAFLPSGDKGFFTGETKPDLCICLDCGDTRRFEERKELFFSGKSRICIDHHATSEPFADLNYIDPSACATAEIIYCLLRELETCTGITLIDPEIGEAVLSGIMTDTGNFQYSNTTAKSHRIAAELLSLGVDCSATAVQLFQTVRPERIRLSAAVLDRMELFADGLGAMATVTQEQLLRAGAEPCDADGIVETLRSIRGVETAVLLKEYPDGKIKVSMRAKSRMNVAEIAAEYGGGGHIRAAGYTLLMSVEEAEKLVKEKVEAAFGKMKAEEARQDNHL